MTKINLLDIGGFKIGHADNTASATGCTVFLPHIFAPCGVDVRGGGPASREIHLLDSQMAASGLHAILLSGGSAFSLEAATGVMEYLEQRGIGFDTGIAKVPLVCQSALFDLGVACANIRPTKAMAYAACENASATNLALGNVGAGIGCTVGKILGMDFAMKTGIGAYAIQVGNIKIGALVALNALGDIFDAAGTQVAGVLSADKKSMRNSEQILYAMQETAAVATNTTLAIVIMNCKFTKSELNKIASMAQNGYARAITPIHTMADGDTIYTTSVGNETADLNVIGTLAATVVQKAVINAALTATGAYGFVSYNDLQN